MKRLNGKILVGVLALVLAGTTRALFGGFGVAAYLPKANDPKMKDVVLLVQPVGCHGPGASMSAKAEGLVKGVRRSVNLTPVLLDAGNEGQGGLFAIRREWASEGAWLLVLTATKAEEGNGKTITIHATSIVKLDENGSARVIDRSVTKNWDAATTLPDGKTKMHPWTFSGDDKVPAMYMVSGDLKAAIDYTLRKASADR